MSERYPLKALLSLREAVRSGCEQRLADAIETERQRAGDLAAAERALAEAEQRLRAQREPASGVARAAQLVERERFARRLDEARAEASRRCAAAAEALAAARVATAEAKAALASAEADVELVERNRERWSEARRADEMRRAEAELEDIVAARGPGGEL